MPCNTWQGVLPTDTCHNLLIEVCTQAGRLDEALDLVKRLARQHGAMQQPTLNSLTRALSASHVDRALRLLSLMNTLGLRATRCFVVCSARAGRSAMPVHRTLRQSPTTTHTDLN
jgi:pentatricopeptide repeat protein